MFGKFKEISKTKIKPSNRKVFEIKQFYPNSIKTVETISY